MSGRNVSRHVAFELSNLHFAPRHYLLNALRHYLLNALRLLGKDDVHCTNGQTPACCALFISQGLHPLPVHTVQDSARLHSNFLSRWPLSQPLKDLCRQHQHTLLLMCPIHGWTETKSMALTLKVLMT